MPIGRILPTSRATAMRRALHESVSEAKDKAPHGTWQGWLGDYFDGSVRTAQAYMRVAARRDEVEAAKTQSSAPLSLDGALRTLSAPKDAPRAGRPATLSGWTLKPRPERTARISTG